MHQLYNLYQEEPDQQVVGGDFVPLLHSCEHHLEYCIHFWAPNTRRTWSCWSRSRGGNEDEQRYGAVPYEDRLGELGLLSLEKRRLQGDLIAAFQYLKGAYRKAGEGLFIQASNDRTRGNGLNWKRVNLDEILGRNFLL